MKRFKDAINGDKPIFVDFYASWCGPCRVMSPIVDKMERKYGDKMEFLKIDVDECEELALMYKVNTVPSLMIFKKGELMWRVVGIQSQSMLEEVIKRFV
ncbi:MAG: thioredoxin [Bacteroidales bacterium]|nr:thioredoxin [Bacteroidales bacterium]